MSKAKEIFLQITFLLVIIFFYGITVFSDFQTQQPYAFEMMENENTVESNLFSGFDMLEDVHVVKKELIPNTSIFSQTKMMFAKTLFILSHPSYSIWQPPKLV